MAIAGLFQKLSGGDLRSNRVRWVQTSRQESWDHDICRHAKSGLSSTVRLSISGRDLQSLENAASEGRQVEKPTTTCIL